MTTSQCPTESMAPPSGGGLGTSARPRMQVRDTGHARVWRYWFGPTYGRPRVLPRVAAPVSAYGFALAVNCLITLVVSQHGTASVESMAAARSTSSGNPRSTSSRPLTQLRRTCPRSSSFARKDAAATSASGDRRISPREATMAPAPMRSSMLGRSESGSFDTEVQRSPQAMMVQRLADPSASRSLTRSATAARLVNARPTRAERSMRRTCRPRR